MFLSNLPSLILDSCNGVLGLPIAIHTLSLSMVYLHGPSNSLHSKNGAAVCITIFYSICEGHIILRSKNGNTENVYDNRLTTIST